MRSGAKKIPVFGFVLLSLVGCTKGRETKKQETVIDTVMVLEYVHPSYYSERKIWYVDKHGNETYCNNVSLGPKPAVAPRKGEEIVVEVGYNNIGTKYVRVLENLNAQDLKAMYLKQKHR